jgi:hypothetical protein
MVMRKSALIFFDANGLQLDALTDTPIEDREVLTIMHRLRGEFAATFDERQSLLKALRSKNFKITSIRNHMAGEHPQRTFLVAR